MREFSIPQTEHPLNITNTKPKKKKPTLQNFYTKYSDYFLAGNILEDGLELRSRTQILNFRTPPDPAKL